MKHTRRTQAGALLAATTLLGLCTACAGQTEQSGDTQAITYLEPNWFTSLYPPAAGFYPNGGVVNQITDRLLYQDPETLELHPWIATKLPEINEDATVYTFDIRTDVTYSDGSPLTAENVVANFDLYGKGDKERLLNASEQISNYDYGEVIDEDTVRFHFTAPSPGFAQAVSVYNAGLLSDATLALDNESFGPGSAHNVIGSGPFVIAGEELGISIELRAREDYDWAPPILEHQGRARLDSVTYRLAAEEAMRTGAVLSGQADIVRDVTASAERHLQDRGVQIVSRGTNAMNNQIAMRPQHPYLQDIRVRRAITHSVDREELLRILFSDSYPVATSSVAATGLGYKNQGDAYTYDPELARQLLDEAGWVVGNDGIRVKDGERLHLTVNYAQTQPRAREVMTMVQSNLRDIGIELSVLSGDRSTQNVASKDPNKVQLYHTMVGRADYDAIESHYAVGRRDSFINQDENDNVIDQHLEDLLQTVVSTPDDTGRARAVEAVQDYVTEQAYTLPLFEEPQVYALSPRLCGFSVESVARPALYSAYLQEGDTPCRTSSNG